SDRALGTGTVIGMLAAGAVLAAATATGAGASAPCTGCTRAAARVRPRQLVRQVPIRHVFKVRAFPEWSEGRAMPGRAGRADAKGRPDGMWAWQAASSPRR